MFQTFSDTSAKDLTPERISRLRDELNDWESMALSYRAPTSSRANMFPRTPNGWAG
jgi:hypothetical protein